jgi:hypothetical protein
MTFSIGRVLLIFLLTFRSRSSNHPVEEWIPLPGVYQASYKDEKCGQYTVLGYNRCNHSKF